MAGVASNQPLPLTIISYVGYVAGFSICLSTRSWVRPFDPTCHKAPLSNITLLNSSAFVGAAFNVVNQNGKVEDL
jgi:hypothetical protein